MPNGINPETGTPTTPQQAATPAPAAPAANYDAMPFGQAFASARKAGAKDFMWKGKKYAVQMAPKQAATPKPAPAKPLPGKTPFPGAGQVSDNPAAESRDTSIMKELNAMRRIAGLKEFDMNLDNMMKGMNGSKTSSFKSNINGKQDDTESGFNSAKGEFDKMAGGMNLPGGAKLDPSNLQGSIDSIKNGIMGKFGDISKQATSNAPGAMTPNPVDKQDPKELLKQLSDEKLNALSGDDAKVMLQQLKKMAGI
jgi:hypothetical protein